MHRTDNARCLIALTLASGQIGKPGSGLHPLRSLNNVQGACESGLIPLFYSAYQRVSTPEAKQRFEQFWNTTLDPEPGHTVVEIMHAAEQDSIRGMYIVADNPAMSRPDVDHAREAMAQFGRKALKAPDDAGEDLRLINEIGRYMGWDWSYGHPRQVFEEMRRCMDSMAGITWDRLERDSSVSYPCVKEGDPGDSLTNPVVDPDGKIPGSKYCAATVIPGGKVPEQLSFGGGGLLATRQRETVEELWRGECLFEGAPA